MGKRTGKSDSSPSLDFESLLRSTRREGKRSLERVKEDSDSIDSDASDVQETRSSQKQPAKKDPHPSKKHRKLNVDSDKGEEEDDEEDEEDWATAASRDEKSDTETSSSSSISPKKKQKRDKKQRRKNDASQKRKGSQSESHGKKKQRKVKDATSDSESGESSSTEEEAIVGKRKAKQVVTISSGSESDEEQSDASLSSEDVPLVDNRLRARRTRRSARDAGVKLSQQLRGSSSSSSSISSRSSQNLRKRPKTRQSGDVQNYGVDALELDEEDSVTSNSDDGFSDSSEEQRKKKKKKRKKDNNGKKKSSSTKHTSKGSKAPGKKHQQKKKAKSDETLTARELRGNPVKRELFIPVFPEELDIEKVLASRGTGPEKEYLIKWKGYSYLHVEWVEEGELKENPYMARKLQLFDMKASDDDDSDSENDEGFEENKENGKHSSKDQKTGKKGGEEEEDDEEQLERGKDEDESESFDDYFSPGFTQVDRILAYHEEIVDEGKEPKFGGAFSSDGTPLDENGEEIEEDLDDSDTSSDEDIKKTTSKNKKGKKKAVKRKFAHVLVKWEQLPYSEMTWESVEVLEDSVLELKLKIFRAQNELDYKKASELFAPLEERVVKLSKSAFRKISDKSLYGGWEDEEPSLHLRDYQLEGVNWLLWNWTIGRSGSMLADEMGLGKTIQVIATLDELREGRRIPEKVDAQAPRWLRTRGPHLIVVPLSCVFQWKREFESWTKMNVIVYHGQQDSREEIEDYEFFFRRSEQHKGGDGRKIHHLEYMRFEVMITTYEIVSRDASKLRKIPWRTLVVDEAHRLKNKDSRLFRELSTYERDYTILLTGTPIQNNTEELWSLINFLVRSGSQQKTISTANKRKSRSVSEEDETYWFLDQNHQEFMTRYGNVQRHSQVEELTNLLKPFLLRRVKEDVGKQLPPKEETIVEVELSYLQKQYYRGIYEKNTTFLFRGGKQKNGPNLMNIMMELRKVCNHPFLNRGVEDMIVEDTIKKEQEILVAAGEDPVPPSSQKLERLRSDLMVQSSGKLMLLDKLLPKLRAGDHRVLIFSQMVKMLDILEDFCELRSFEFERVDGSVTGIKRQAAIDRFSAPDSKHFIMLISTRAGGLGLNLACADTVIIFDSDWNPQNDLQAQARSHRIGQTKPVKVYRLLSRKTYETVMFEKASIKLGLDKAMLSSGKGSTSSSKSGLSAKEVDHILKHGAYAAFGESEKASEEASRKFFEASIEEILESASHVVNYADIKPGDDQKSSLLASFSKATFTTNNEDNETTENVDIDDPEFWTKVAGFEKPQSEQQEYSALHSMGLSADGILSHSRKRQRRAVVRMGMVDDDSANESGNEGNKKGKSSKASSKLKKRKDDEGNDEYVDQSNDEGSSGEESLDSIDLKPSKRRKQRREWSLYVIQKALDGLLRYGWGRWVRVRRTFKMDDYGDDVRTREFCAALVQSIAFYASDVHAVDAARDFCHLPKQASFQVDKTAVDIVQLARQVVIPQVELQRIESLLTRKAFVTEMLDGGARRCLEVLQLHYDIARLVHEAEASVKKELMESLYLHHPRPEELVGNEATTLTGGFEYTVTIPINSRTEDLALGLLLVVLVKDEFKHQLDKIEEFRWVIGALSKGLICDRAGFTRKGDRLVEVNGIPTKRMSSIVDVVEAYFNPEEYKDRLYRVKNGLEFYESMLTIKQDADPRRTPRRTYRKLVFKSGCSPFLSPDYMPPLDSLQIKFAKPYVSVSRLWGSQLPNEEWSAEDVANWIITRLSGRTSWEPMLKFLQKKSLRISKATLTEVLDRIKAVAPKQPEGDDEDDDDSEDASEEKEHNDDAKEDAEKKEGQAGKEKTTPSPEEGEQARDSRTRIIRKGDWDLLFTNNVALKISNSGKVLYAKEFLPHLILRNAEKPWTREMDIHLLIGVAKYGLDKFSIQDIAMDPALVFSQVLGREKVQKMYIKMKRMLGDVEQQASRRRKPGDEAESANNKVESEEDLTVDRVLEEEGPGKYLPPLEVLQAYVHFLVLPSH